MIIVLYVATIIFKHYPVFFFKNYSHYVEKLLSFYSAAMTLFMHTFGVCHGLITN